MATPRSRTPVTRTRTGRTKNPSVPLQFGTHDAEASGSGLGLALGDFMRPYVPPRNKSAPIVKLPKEPKYKLVTPMIPPVVIE